MTRWMGAVALGLALVGCKGDETTGGGDDYVPSTVCTVGFSGSSLDDTTERQEYDAKGRLLWQGVGSDRTADGSVAFDWSYAGQTATGLTITSYGAKGPEEIWTLSFDAQGHLTDAMLDGDGDGTVDQTEHRTLTYGGDTVTEVEIDLDDDGTADASVGVTITATSQVYEARNAGGSVIETTTIALADGHIDTVEVAGTGRTGVWTQDWSWEGDIVTAIESYESMGFQNGPVSKDITFSFNLPDTRQPSKIFRETDRGDDGTAERTKARSLIYEGDCDALDIDWVWGSDFEAEFLSVDLLRWPTAY